MIIPVDTNGESCPVSDLVCLCNPQSPLGGSSDNLMKNREEIFKSVNIQMSTDEKQRKRSGCQEVQQSFLKTFRLQENNIYSKDWNKEET